MTPGDNGAPSARREGSRSDDRAPVPARRSRAMPVILGIVILILIAGGLYLYADRNGHNETASTGPKVANEGARQTPAPPPPSQPGAQPASPQEQATRSPPASQPAPTQQAPSPPSPPSNQSAQAPAPAEQQTAKPQPMQQQATNLPAANEMMSVRVGRANIRSGPSLSARVVATTSKGTKLKVLRHAGKWVEVEAGGGNGWINTKVLGPD